jgi:uncharacterized membrane protein (Fun14 family)
VCTLGLCFSGVIATPQGVASENSNAGAKGAGNPPWQARTLWVAAGLTLLGLVLWVAAPAKSPAPSSPAGQATLAEASGQAVATRVHSLQGSPAMFRFGLSYIAGFFLGYGLRRYVTMTLVVAAVAAGAIFWLRKAGWIDLDWSSIESHLNNSFAWLKGQAEALKVFITGYVPSAAAAGVGLFLGARWR